MRIAVVGDTHGRIEKIKKELRAQKPDYMFFTGDHYSDARRIAYHLKLGFDAVVGNCDARKAGSAEKLIEMAGKRFYIVHGHQYGVKHNLQSLYYRGKEVEADVVLFGHTHVPLCEEFDNLWLINPGSPSLPRMGKIGSYAMIKADSQVFSPEIIYLKT
jgi:hypothetical protein